MHMLWSLHYNSRTCLLQYSNTLVSNFFGILRTKYPLDSKARITDFWLTGTQATLRRFRGADSVWTSRSLLAKSAEISSCSNASSTDLSFKKTTTIKSRVATAAAHVSAFIVGAIVCGLLVCLWMVFLYTAEEESPFWWILFFRCAKFMMSSQVDLADVWRQEVSNCASMYEGECPLIELLVWSWFGIAWSWFGMIILSLQQGS